MIYQIRIRSIPWSSPAGCRWSAQAAWRAGSPRPTHSWEPYRCPAADTACRTGNRSRRRLTPAPLAPRSAPPTPGSQRSDAAPQSLQGHHNVILFHIQMHTYKVKCSNQLYIMLYPTSISLNDATKGEFLSTKYIIIIQIIVLLFSQSIIIFNQ